MGVTTGHDASYAANIDLLFVLGVKSCSQAQRCNNLPANAHLRWAFSLAAQLFLKSNERVSSYSKLTNKHGAS